MNVFTGIVVYLMIFWTLLFAILPWGNNAPHKIEEGMAGSAPENPRIKQKFMICAGLSVLIWLVIFLLIHFQVVDFFEMSRQMILEDKS